MNTTARFGYGEANITPDWSVELVGFGPGRRSNGVLHPLRASALVCEDASGRMALITIDDIGFTKALGDALRDRLAESLGASRERVMLCFSHTHSAPNAAEEPQYYALVCEGAQKALCQALATLAPMYAAWGVGRAALGVNRREAGGPVDDRVGVLALTGEAGRPKLLLVRASAHANVLTSDNFAISSDWFGAARERLEREYGCPVMLVQGASGDLRPRFQQSNANFLEIHGYAALPHPYDAEERAIYRAQSLQALDDMASLALGGVEDALRGMEPRPVERLWMRSRFLRLCAEVPDETAAARIAEDAKRETGVDGSAWLAEAARLRAAGVTSQCENVEMQLFTLNDGCLCGVPNELMCEIALSAARRAGSDKLFLGAYVNGIDSYLPTAKEYDKGGYEVLWSNLTYYRYYGRLMPFHRESAAHVAELAAANWQRP